MKTKIISWFGIVVVTVAMTQVNAANAASGLDKVEEHTKQMEEQRMADKAVAEMLFSTASLQKNVDRLSRQKTSLEREVSYVRIKQDGAIRELGYATRAEPADKELVASAQRELQYWQGRAKMVEGEFAKLEEELKKAVDDYRKSVQQPVESKLILPGEVVQLFVLEDETFNGLYQVRSGGYVVLPRVGRVSVVGKDLTAAEKTIKEALESTQLKQGTVMLERSAGVYNEDSSDVIYLAGEFKTTGPLKVPAGMQPTLVTTILRSGGLTSSADLTKVKLLRLEAGKSLVEEVNVQAILEGAGMQSDLALAAGDILVVPSFAPVIYVTGNITRPGVIQLSPDEELTAYSAILRSGGFARFAKTRGVYVLRDRGNGEKSRIPVNIKEVQSGKQPDVILQGKDIVVVPEKFFSW